MQENRETIGQRLKRTRLSRQVSLEKAAEVTRVRLHYLQALEEDNYSLMSSAAQGRGFLRLYADYLGLDLEAAMNELREGEATDAPAETPAPAAVTPPAAPPPAPASAPDGEAGRRPFWSRLLRRPASEEPAPEPESAPAEELEAAPVDIPEPEPAPRRVKKPAATSFPKGKQAAVPSRSKAGTPKAAAKKEDKKKVQRKSKPSKKRR